jgi:hypothetical protein
MERASNHNMQLWSVNMERSSSKKSVNLMGGEGERSFVPHFTCPFAGTDSSLLFCSTPKFNYLENIFNSFGEGFSHCSRSSKVMSLWRLKPSPPLSALNGAQ